LDFVSYFPYNSGEFAGDGGFDFIIMHEPGLEFFITNVETVLGFPRNFFNPVRLAFLTFGKGGGDFGVAAIVSGALIQIDRTLSIFTLRAPRCSV
jgi:hypothetical protein